MNRRLQTILDIEHLSASQLADALGIQRGGISHLLSGRNKPSFDFLERILRKFPEISAEWLITGNGKPIKDEFVSKASNYSFDGLDNDKELFEIQNDNEEYLISDSNVQSAVGSESQESGQNGSTTPLSTESVIRERKAIKVIIYFSDGTYSEFSPFSVSSQRK